jgi:hypothetical protein
MGFTFEFGFTSVINNIVKTSKAIINFSTINIHIKKIYVY